MRLPRPSLRLSQRAAAKAAPKPPGTVCPFFQKTGSCRKGANCDTVHSLLAGQGQALPANWGAPSGASMSNPFAAFSTQKTASVNQPSAVLGFRRAKDRAYAFEARLSSLDGAGCSEPGGTDRELLTYSGATGAEPLELAPGDGVLVPVEREVQSSADLGRIDGSRLPCGLRCRSSPRSLDDRGRRGIRSPRGPGARLHARAWRRCRRGQVRFGRDCGLRLRRGRNYLPLA